MFALLLAFFEVINLERRDAKYYMFLAFVSALVLAGCEAALAHYSGVWMSPWVAGFGFIWIFFSAVTLWFRGGWELDSVFILAAADPEEKTKAAAKMVVDVLMGFFVIEASTVLYFYLIPGKPLYVFGPLLGILIMYFSAKLQGHKFDWKWFFWPSAGATIFMALHSLAVALNFITQPVVPEHFGPWFLQQVGMHKLGTGELATRLFALSLITGALCLLLYKFKVKKAGWVGGLATLLFLAAVGFWSFPEYQPEITAVSFEQKGGSGKKEQQTGGGAPAPVAGRVVPDVPPGLVTTGYSIPPGKKLYIERLRPELPAPERWVKDGRRFHPITAWPQAEKTRGTRNTGPRNIELYLKLPPGLEIKNFRFY